MFQTKNESINFFEENNNSDVGVKYSFNWKRISIIVTIIAVIYGMFSFFNKEEVTTPVRVLTIEDMAIKTEPINEQLIRQQMLEGKTHLPLSVSSGTYIVNNRLDSNLDTAKTNADLAIEEAAKRLRSFNNSVSEYSQQMETNLRK